ncbi:hypothetical protein K8I61_04260 [bacterium]|nr:hypothetical protein [bacterium]
MTLLALLAISAIAAGCAYDARDAVDDTALDDPPSPEPGSIEGGAPDDSGDDDTAPIDDDSGDDDTEPPGCEAFAGATRAPLRAGLATGDLWAPIGVSPGGYGSRPGPSHPYAVAMGGSTGYFGKPDVKALALDNGEERLVIARIAAAGVSEYLYREVLSDVCRIGGFDLSGRLWLSATHSHSGPSHFFPVPMILGGVGTDVFDRGFTRRLSASIARAIVASTENLQPATLAATVVTPFDPGDVWSADRRCANDPPRYKEDRLFFARVDRADGSPLAALMSFPVHGVWMGKSLLSTDIPGAIELGFENTFDTPVEAFFLQGPAGDVNPSVTPHGHDDEQGMEWHARSIAPVLREVYDGLAPEADIALGMATASPAISRDAIGYADDEFGWTDPFTGAFHPYEDGAFYCGSPDVWSTIPYFARLGSIIDCARPETSLVDGYYGCVLPLLFVDAWWTWALNPTEIGDVRLGDYLLAFIPGELTSWLSKRLRENLNAATGVPDDRIATFGYSNGYQSYLLTEWDWMQGGYETSINSWGPKFGDWLVDRNVALAADLLAGVAAPAVPPAQPEIPWPDLLPVAFEEAESAGDVLAPPAASYRRFETVEFSWAGGFTGADRPRVTFEAQAGGEFEPVRLANGRIMADGDMTTILRYEASPDYDTRRFPARRLHRYTIAWELTADVSPGRYRVRVEGQTWEASAIVPYTVVSDAFDVVESDAVRVANLSVAPIGGDLYAIECDALWPPNPTGYRLRHPDFGSAEWSTVTGGQALATVLEETGAGESVPLTYVSDGRFHGVWHRAAPGARTAVIRAGDLTDAFGNANGEDSETAPVPN